MRRANERARGAIGLRSHAAGVHDDHIGFRSLTLTAPGGAQLRGDCLAIGPRCTASEVLNVK
jgi:hypothetical protein